MWNWSRGSSAGDGGVLPTPPVLPDFLADHAIHPGLFFRDRDEALLRLEVCDLEHQLGADRLLEFLAILDSDHEGARSADHAVLVVKIQIVDIHGRVGR